MKGILDYGLYYLPSNSFNLIGYSDSVGMEIWMIKRAPLAFCFFMGDTLFTLTSKKQPIVILSTSEVEFVLAT